MGPGSEGSTASWGSTRFIGVQRKLKFVFLFEGYGSIGNFRQNRKSIPLGAAQAGACCVGGGGQKCPIITITRLCDCELYGERTRYSF